MKVSFRNKPSGCYIQL